MAPAAEVLLYFADRAQHVARGRPPGARKPAAASCPTATRTRRSPTRGTAAASTAQLILAVAAPGHRRPEARPHDPARRARGRRPRPCRPRGPHDRLETEVREFHDRVRAGYLEMAAAEPRALGARGRRGPGGGRRATRGRGGRGRAASSDGMPFPDDPRPRPREGPARARARPGPPASRAPAERPGRRGEADARRLAAPRPPLRRRPGRALQARAGRALAPRAGSTPTSSWWCPKTATGFLARETIKIEHIRDADARDRAACPSRRGPAS